MSGHAPQFEAIFDYIAGIGWSRVAAEHGYHTSWLREQCRARQDKNVTLLDLGCADGLIGGVLVEEGLHGHFAGLDVSAKMLESCAARGLYHELARGDVDAGIHYAGDARFDLVCACGLFEYVADVGAVLDEVRAISAPHVELWATFHAPPTPAQLATLPEGWRHAHRCHTANQARAVIEGAGWRVLSIEQRVAGDAVTSDDAGGLRSLGWKVEYLFVRASVAD